MNIASGNLISFSTSDDCVLAAVKVSFCFSRAGQRWFCLIIMRLTFRSSELECNLALLVRLFSSDRSRQTQDFSFYCLCSTADLTKIFGAFYSSLSRSSSLLSAVMCSWKNLWTRGTWMFIFSAISEHTQGGGWLRYGDEEEEVCKCKTSQWMAMIGKIAWWNEEWSWPWVDEKFYVLLLRLEIVFRVSRAVLSCQWVFTHRLLYNVYSIHL